MISLRIRSSHEIAQISTAFYDDKDIKMGHSIFTSIAFFNLRSISIFNIGYQLYNF